MEEESCTIREFLNLSWLRRIFEKRVTLKYNGRVYRLKPEDVPDLRGSGRIVITNKEGFQEQYTEDSLTNISLEQDGRQSYINGVNVEDLIKKLESR